jgi:signal peptidase I
MSRGTVLRACREASLTLGALLGLVGILLVVAGAVFGVRPLLFRSGSMAPTIDTGDLAIARSVPATDLRAGDIVSVVDAEGQRVTHRLVSAADQGPARQLKLKGDANRMPDAEVYTVARADRVLFDVPKVGYVVSAATSRAGVFVLGLYVALLLVLAVGGRRGDPDPPDPGGPRGGGRRRAGRRPSGAVMARSATVATVAGLLAWSGPASATPWTDGVPITGQALTAYTVPPPATFSCGPLGILSVTFSWAAVAGATNYTVHFGSGGSLTRTVNGTTTTFTSALSGGTAWVQANVNYGSTTWTSAPSDTRGYTVALVSLCG